MAVIKIWEKTMKHSISKNGPLVCTHTQTHTHTHTYLQCRKMHKSIYKHAQQPGTITYTWNLLFVRVSSSELWACHLFRWFQSKSMCAKLFHTTGTCQTLVYVIDSNHLLLHWSGHISVAMIWGLLRQQPLKMVAGPDSNWWHALWENITHHVDSCSTSYLKAV